MKIGILTHQYINNYGAFLQAWALREAIAELFPNDEVQIIDYVNLKHFIINAGGWFRFYKNRESFKDWMEKIKLPRTFAKARNQEMILSKRCFNAKQINALDFDCIIVGSDEVWNYKDTKGNVALKFGEGLTCKNLIAYIPGCTMVFNNCLMRKIQERKPEFDLITMHDCWLYYICLGIGGKIISDKNAYIQYRQHGNNVIGAKRISIRKKIQMICQQNGSPRAKMIDEIIRLYGQDMKKEMLSKYKTFASYPKSIKAKNYFFKQSTENVFSTRELQKAKLRILFGSL